MKKILSLALVFVMCLSLVSCGSSEMKIGEPVKKGVTQVTLLGVEMADTNYLKGEKNSADFLSPVNKDDIQVNQRFVKAPTTDNGAIVVTAMVENVGNSGLDFSAGFFNVIADDDSSYYATEVYAKDENGLWQKYDKVSVEKDATAATEVRFVVWVPSTVINSGLSLDLDFYGKTYTIR